MPRLKRKSVFQPKKGHRRKISKRHSVENPAEYSGFEFDCSSEEAQFETIASISTESKDERTSITVKTEYDSSDEAQIETMAFSAESDDERTLITVKTEYDSSEEAQFETIAFSTVPNDERTSIIVKTENDSSDEAEFESHLSIAFSTESKDERTSITVKTENASSDEAQIETMASSAVPNDERTSITLKTENDSSDETQFESIAFSTVPNDERTSIIVKKEYDSSDEAQIETMTFSAKSNDERTLITMKTENDSSDEAQIGIMAFSAEFNDERTSITVKTENDSIDEAQIESFAFSTESKDERSFITVKTEHDWKYISDKAQTAISGVGAEKQTGYNETDHNYSAYRIARNSDSDMPLPCDHLYHKSDTQDSTIRSEKERHPSTIQFHGHGYSKSALSNPKKSYRKRKRGTPTGKTPQNSNKIDVPPHTRKVTWSTEEKSFLKTYIRAIPRGSEPLTAYWKRCATVVNEKFPASSARNGPACKGLAQRLCIAPATAMPIADQSHQTAPKPTHCCSASQTDLTLFVQKTELVGHDPSSTEAKSLLSMPRLNKNSAFQPKKVQRKKSKRHSVEQQVEYSDFDFDCSSDEAQFETVAFSEESKNERTSITVKTDNDLKYSNAETQTAISAVSTETQTGENETDHNYSACSIVRNSDRNSDTFESDILNYVFLEQSCRRDSGDTDEVSTSIIELSSSEEIVETTSFESYCIEVEKKIVPGFQIVKKASKVILYRTYQETDLTVQLTVTILDNLTCQLAVHEKVVPQTHEVWDRLSQRFYEVEHVVTLCERIMKYNVCCGNPDEKYTSLIPIEEGLVNNNNQTMAYHEGNFNATTKYGNVYHGTIRTTDCQLLVRGERCKQCISYRDCLRKRKLRMEERTDSKRTFLHTTFKHTDMTRENLVQKLSEQKLEIGSLKHKVLQLEKQMKKIISKDGEPLEASKNGEPLKAHQSVNNSVV